MSNFSFVFDSGSTVKDLFTDYSVYVSGWTGGGMPPQQNITVPYALGDGSYFQRTVVQERVIQLACTINYGGIASTVATLHSKRKAVIAAINRDVLNSGTFTLRYSGAGATSIDIPVRYNGGLELDMAADSPLSTFTISLLATDPFWRTSSTATETFGAVGVVSNGAYISMRDSTGVWTGLSGTNSPAAAPNSILYANSKLYVAAGSHLYVRASGTWTDYTANAAVDCMCVGPDGTTIYVGGAFTTINSVSAAYVATLSGTTFADPASGGTAFLAECRSLVTMGGSVYGTCFNTISKLSQLVGTVWTTIASDISTNAPPVNTAIAVGSAIWWICDDTVNDNLWAHTSALGDQKIGYAAKGSMKSLCNSNGTIYCGGSFTSINSVTVTGLATYSGSGWSAVASSATTVSALAYTTTTFAGGTFANYVVDTNGWTTIGEIPAAAVTALAGDASNNLYIGYNSASNPSTGSGLTKSIVNAGDRNAYPYSITVTRTGGTSATLTAITNTYTGDSLLFNYAMGNGETITINLTPGARSITSSSGANLVSQLLAGSKFTTWSVSPGTHTYNVDVTGVGSPTMAAVLKYYPTYWAADGVAA